MVIDGVLGVSGGTSNEGDREDQLVYIWKEILGFGLMGSHHNCQKVPMSLAYDPYIPIYY